MKCRNKLLIMINNDGTPPKRLPSFNEVIVTCQGMLEKIMTTSPPRLCLVDEADKFRKKVATNNANVPASGSGVQLLPLMQLCPPKSAALRNTETAGVAPQVVGEVVGMNNADVQASISAIPDLPLIQLWPPKSPAKRKCKRNIETASVAPQVVGEEVGMNNVDGEASTSAVPDLTLIQLWPPKSPAKRNIETASVAPEVGEEMGMNNADVQASTSAIQEQELPLIQLWPPKSPAEPTSETACVVRVQKLSESDVSKSKSPLAQQSTGSTAAVDSASEGRETVDRAALRPSTSTATGREVNNVESSDESDNDILDADFYRPSTKRANTRRTRKWWSDLEEELLYKGVQTHGAGSWALIRANFVTTRSNVDIKDKWRNLQRHGRLKELAKKHGPLPLI